MFLILSWRSRCALTISSPSTATQTTVTCGLPSLFSVVKCARGPVVTRVRTDSGIVILLPPHVDMEKLPSMSGRTAIKQHFFPDCFLAVNAHSRLRLCEVRRRYPHPEGSNISSAYFQAAVHCRATRTTHMLRADPEAKFPLSCRTFRDISQESVGIKEGCHRVARAAEEFPR